MREQDYTTKDEDVRLVALCQNGDLEAFEELVRRHEKRMLNIAYRMIGNYEEACDIVQDAFVSAYKNISGFKGMCKFSTWFSTIVINFSKKRLKELRVQRFHEPETEQSANSNDNSMKTDCPSNNPLADEIFEKKEVQKRVQLCLNRLENEFREVIILKDVQGFSYGDISDILDIPEGTVKSRLFRGRAVLKNCLKRFIGAM